MNKATDKELYQISSNLIKEYYPKHSAYRSMQIVRLYKSLGGKFKQSKEKGTANWIKERWKNLTPYALGLVKSIKDCPPCGKKHPDQLDYPSICRPTVKVNKDTPKLGQSYTKRQIQEALYLKMEGRRINWNEL